MADRAVRLLLLAGALAAGPAAAQDSTGTRTARISYLTTNSAYITAGRAEGLREGAQVNVIRGAVSVAVLRVTYVSTHQASCDIVSSTAGLVVGDVVRWVPAADTDSTAPVPVPRPVATRRQPTPGFFGIRGRVGLHYLTISEHDGGGQFHQPAMDVRLLGGGLFDTPLGLILDVRARSAVENEPPTRVFQAALTWNAPGSPYRMALGRQYAPGISSVGLVDGLSLERVGRGVDVGIFSGTQPTLPALGFSTEIVQGGWYLRGHNRPGASAMWGLTFGGSGSYQSTSTGFMANREFLFLQGTYSGRRAFVSIAQEVDYYRPWKQQMAGGPAISPTSTYANFRFAVSRPVSVYGGFDNRRNVLLYRDVVSPETSFDDAFRQGAWLGTSARMAGGHLLVALDGRLSDAGVQGRTHSYSGTLGLERITSLGFGLRARSTRYTSPGREGWLHAFALGVEPGSRARLELSGGFRDEQDSGLFVPPTHVTWFGADLEVTVARAWYITLSGNRQRGPLENSDLLYAGLTWRF